MKIFISWSGNQSQSLALALRDWLPSVLQSVEPYVSSEDIDKGTRWSSDIAKELDRSNFGIICVTPSNINSQWINFEAGALSKALDKSLVCPLLFGLKKAELQGPLLQFQATICNKEDIKKLVISINNAIEPKSNSLDDPRLEKVFDVWWNQLEEAIKNIEKQTITDEPISESKSPKLNIQNQRMLEEILEISRSQYKILRSPEQLLPYDYLEHILSDRNHVDQRVFRDLEDSFLYLNSLLFDKNCISKDELSQAYESLEKPIRYLLQKNIGRSRNLIHKTPPIPRLRNIDNKRPIIPIINHPKLD